MLKMQIEFTNHCNFRCIFCPHAYYKKKSPLGNPFDREKGFMSQEIFNLSLSNANKYAKQVTLGFFGEPLLHPKFVEYINSFPKNHLYKLILNTNFSLVTNKVLEALNAVDIVKISFDANSSDLWNTLCPGGPVLDMDGNKQADRYGCMSEKIERWLEREERPRTTIIHVVSSYNENEVGEFIKEWQPKLRKGDEILTKTVLSYGGIIYDRHMTTYPCNVQKGGKITVCWDGNCTPCNLDVNAFFKVGNIKQITDIQDIIDSSAYRSAMQQIQRKEGICSRCFDANNRSEDKVYTNKGIKRHWWPL